MQARINNHFIISNKISFGIKKIKAPNARKRKAYAFMKINLNNLLSGKILLLLDYYTEARGFFYPILKPKQSVKPRHLRQLQNLLQMFDEQWQILHGPNFTLEVLKSGFPI